MSTYEANRYNFSGASITALNGSNIASGTVADARIPAFATSKITSGTFADARISSSSVTAHVSAITTASGTWTPALGSGFGGAMEEVHSNQYYRIGNVCFCYAGWKWDTDGDNDSGLGAGTSFQNNDTLGHMTGLPITPASLDPCGFGHAQKGQSFRTLYIRQNGNWGIITTQNRKYDDTTSGSPQMARSAEYNSWGAWETNGGGARNYTYVAFWHRV